MPTSDRSRTAVDHTRYVTHVELAEFREEMRSAVVGLQNLLRAVPTKDDVATTIRSEVSSVAATLRGEAAVSRQISPSTVAAAIGILFAFLGIIGSLYSRDQTHTSDRFATIASQFARQDQQSRDFSPILLEGIENSVEAKVRIESLERSVAENKVDQIRMSESLDRTLQREQDMTKQKLDQQDMMLQREMELKDTNKLLQAENMRLQAELLKRGVGVP